MHLLRRRTAALARWWHRDRADGALDDEIAWHLDLETAKNVAAGMDAVEARRRARLAFGALEAMKEEHRAGRTLRWLDDGARELRIAARTLRRNAGLTLAATITLALGIGANAGIFSVVHSVIVRPLPFPDAGRLMMLSEENPEKHWHHQYAAAANYLDWRERVHAFQDVAAYADPGSVALTGAGDPRVLKIAQVTGNFFSVLGARAEVGRILDSAETWAAGTPVAVLSHAMWTRQFAASPSVIGRMMRLDGVDVQIVGVMPASFVYPYTQVDAWTPMAWNRNDRSKVFFRRAHGIRAIARLRAGVPAVQAMAEFQGVVHQLQREYPATNRVMGADMTPLHEFLIGDVRLPLLILQGAVVLLLLIACANVGNLLLVQAAARERETALRLTLGAGSWRLVRQVLAQSLMLAMLGGGAGVMVGWWGIRMLMRLEPPGMMPVGEVHLDAAVFGYILAVVLLSAMVFGAAPALWNRRRAPADVLREGGRSSSGGHRARRWARALVVSEVALALALTCGAGLLLRSFARLLAVDPGFSSTHVLAVGLDIPARHYDTDDKIRNFYGDLLVRLRAIPGVTGASLALVAPMLGPAYTGDFHIAGHAPDDYGTEVARDVVGPDYFRVMHIPIVAGRGFTPADGDSATQVTVINAALARQYFAGSDPVGQRIAFDKVPDSTSTWYTVVGVMGNVRQRGLGIAPQIEAATPFAQGPNEYMTLMIRTAGDPLLAAPAVRRAVRELDRNVPLASIDAMDDLQRASIANQRFLMTLLMAFAATGLTLAIVGVYGVMAQIASSRSREIGIRMALGAQRHGVQWLVVRQGLTFVAIGVAAGLAGALAAARLMASALYGVTATDPLTFITVPALLLATALVASWIPARLVSRTDPAQVLRE